MKRIIAETSTEQVHISEVKNGQHVGFENKGKKYIIASKIDKIVKGQPKYKCHRLNADLVLYRKGYPTKQALLKDVSPDNAYVFATKAELASWLHS